MAVSNGYNVTSFEFNNTTYNASTGGTIRFEYDIFGEPLEDQTGADEFMTFLAVVNKRGRIRLTLRDVKITVALGTSDTSSDCVLAVKGGTSTMTFVNFHLFAVRGQQGKNELGSCVLEFAHQSANGTAAPMS